MLISKIEVFNYKGFWNSGPIDLSPGFNVIIGKNNAGKSSLLEALSLKFQSSPHRSVHTIPHQRAWFDPVSKVTIQFFFEGGDMEQLFQDCGELMVPVKTTNDADDSFREFQASVANAKQAGDNLQVTYTPEHQFMGGHLAGYSSPKGTSGVRVRYDRVRKQLERKEQTSPVSFDRTFVAHFAQRLKQSIYSFKAERLNIAECHVGKERVLKSDASNLPEVLHMLLTKNTPRFQKLERLVSLIFPDITRITIPVDENRKARIMLWTTDPTLEREDLAIPLGESGTGVGQVLAILYVVLEALTPQCIMIDEPHSFLHPGAIRKLLEILRQYRQHQFIISTHSPVALSALEPEVLILLKKDQAETRAEALRPETSVDLRLCLSELGVRLADIFGADQVLWVEGKTEEICFPEILREITHTNIGGIAIIGVVHTGDLEGRDAKRVFQIYKRLLIAGGLLPPAVAIVLDPEGRTQEEQAALAKDSVGVMRFLPRRMFENYLLNPEVIAVVLNTAEGGDTTITKEAVSDWTAQNQWNRKFFKHSVPEGERTREVWLARIHGAAFLKELFSALTETRVHFDKIRHGVAIARWIILNSPADFAELSGFLAGIFKEKV